MIAPIPPNTRKFVLDPEGWIKDEEAAGRRSIAKQIELANDPDLTLRTLQSQAWLSEKEGIPFRDTIQNWDTLRAGFARRFGFQGAEADDTKFHAHMTDLVARERDKDVYRYGADGDTEAAQATRAESLSQKAYDAGAKWTTGGEDGPLEFAAWVDSVKNNPAYDPKEAAADYAIWNEHFTQGRFDAEAAQPAAEQGYSALSQSDNSLNVTRAIVPLFRNLTPRQRALAVRGIGELGKQYGSTVEAQGPLDQSATAFGRVIVDKGRSINRGAIRANLLKMTFQPGFQDWPDVPAEQMATMMQGAPGAMVKPWSPLSDSQFKPMTKERADALNAVVQQRLTDLDIEAELEDISSGKVNPLRRDTWYQKAALGTAESLANVATVAVPFVGITASALAYQNDSTEKFIKAGIPRDKANAMGWVAGPINALLDKAELLALGAKLPGMKQWAEKYGKNALVNYMGRVAMTSGAELAAETLQNTYVEPAVQEVASWWDKEVPKIKWADVHKEAWTQAPDTFIAILPLALIFSGAATYRDFKNFRQLAGDPLLLEEAGYKPEHIRAILETKTDKAAAEAVKQYWPERIVKEGKASWGDKVMEFMGVPVAAHDGAQAGAEVRAIPAEGVDNTTKAAGADNASAPPGDILSGNGNSVTGEPSTGSDLPRSTPVPENNTQLNADAGISRMFRDDNGWSVEMQDGQRVPVGTVDAAFHFRETLLRARDEKQATAMVQMADEIWKRDKTAGKNSVQIFTGNTVEYNAGQVTSTNPKGEAVTLQFDATNLDRQLQALSPGATSAVIQGRNWVAEDGTRFYETNQSTEGPVTMLHEFAESRFKDFIEGPDGEAMTLAAAKAVAPLFDPAKARSPEERDFAERIQALSNMDARGKGVRRLSMDEVRETMVDLLVGNEIGQRRDGSRMPAGSVMSAVRNALELNAGGALTKFRALLNAVKEYLRGVLGIASRLKKATNDGTLKKGDDFHSFADKVMGLDEQKAHDAAVLKQVGETAPAGESFSLGSASLLENVAKRAEALKKDPAEKLAAYEAISKDLAGMARAVAFNESTADAVTSAGIEAERIDRYKTRSAELLAAVEKDFGDISGAEFLAKATNQPVIDAVMRKAPGDKFPRARLRARDGSTAAEYEGAKELPRWLFGGTMDPDKMAQELYDDGLIRDDSPATMWSELDKALQSAGAAKDRLSQYAQRKAEARTQAREETNAWAAEQMADLPKRQKESGRNDMLRSLRALDAMLFKLPAEVRAKVGGFVSLAGLQTNKAREKFLIDRLGKIEKVMERFLRGEYTSRIEKLFERASKKQDIAGEKAASMVGADAAHLLKQMEAAMELDAAGVAGAVAALDARIASGELTAEQEALALREKELVQLAGDWKNADAAQMAEAHRAALETFEGGWLEWSKKIIAKLEARLNMKANLAVDSGKGGTPKERFVRAEKDMGWRGKLKDVFLGLSSFREVLQYHFGDKSETAKMITDRERKAANQREDEIEEAGDSASDLFKRLGGSTLKGQKLHFKLAQPTVDNPKGGKLSELQIIQATMMWAQEDGKRHMEAFNWDDAAMATLEAGLSPEAKAVRSWLRTRYDAEYAPLNALYKERHGVNLPGHQNYAPITVVPQQAGKGEIVDPVTGVATTGSLLTPGSLRTRSKSAVAEPEFRDSLQTYLAHVRQLAHWKAYYDLAVDLNQVFGNRDLGNVTEAAGGKQGLKVLRAWSDYFAQGGTRDAAAFLALNARLNKASGRAAEMILFGRVGTLLVQSTQLGAALAEMPTGAFVKRFGMLFAGKLGWGEALKSEYIQRRLSAAPPIVRQAMDALAATEPNAIKHAARELGKLIAGADALFTAGTYAITLDFHRTQGAKMGMTGAALDTYAHNEAERSTDRVAQPTRSANRSLFENTSTSPLARAGWAFASEARQKIALAAWAARSFKAEPKQFFRTLAVVWGAGGLAAALIRAAWRDMKDDDDEEVFDARNWSLSRLAAQTITGPLQGIPGFGDMLEAGFNRVFGVYAPGGDIFSQSEDGVTAAVKLLRGKTLHTTTPSGRVKDNPEWLEDSLKSAKSVLFTLGLGNDTIAGANSLLNLVEDGAKVVDNLDGPEKKTGGKK